MPQAAQANFGSLRIVMNGTYKRETPCLATRNPQYALFRTFMQHPAIDTG